MKAIYILLTVILGIILSFIAHAVIEMVYLWWAKSAGVEICWTKIFGSSCALPWWLIISLPILGIILGLFLGFWWWGKIYQSSPQKPNK